MNVTDVLIVGAGSTGLTLGAALTKHGMQATVVDAQPAGENTSRACVVSSRTLEVLERIDVSRQLFKQGIHNHRFSMRDSDRVLIPIDFSFLPTVYPYTLTISQADTKRVLLDAPAAPTTAFVQRLLDTRGFGPGQLVVDEEVWGSHFRIHHRVADNYRAGRLLLAGDAAHEHSPAGGQGMNTGIQDAVALSDAPQQVLAGAPDSTLDRYSHDRRAVGQQVLSLTGRLTRLATLPPELRPARNAAMRLSSRIPAVRRRLAWRLSGLVYRNGTESG